MFSRSEKPEDAAEVFGEASSATAERSPLMLAGLAGLLALAGAFLLIFYLRSDDGNVAAGTDDAAVVEEAKKQVLVVTQTIPGGTSVREIVEAPTAYLSARAVPEEFVAASAVSSVAQLRELDGFVLTSDALPGEQLLVGRFADPSSFDSESAIVLESIVEPPPNHHLIVLTLPTGRALGGTVRPGDVVTVVGNFRIKNADDPGAEYQEISVVVLPAVEVVDVRNALDVAGQSTQDTSTAGVASIGSINLTVAVEADELTDLTYTMEYGEILLAIALPGANNDDTPRAATLVNGVLGDERVWLNDLENGNVLELLGGLEQGSSIEVELPEGADDTQEDAVEDGAEDENTDEAQPGDS